MKSVRVYRNSTCRKCARYAAWHRRLDWLDRVDTSTGNACDSTCEIRS